MEELGYTPLVEGVRKILARSTGGSKDSEFGGVVLRQVPVAQRVVPQEDIRGEVMDFIVQRIEDTDLSPAFIWAIASKVANKISEAIPSNIQINALNDVARKELDSMCVKIEADPSSLEVQSSSSSISVKALRNARRTMEDRHVIISDLNLVAGLEASPQYEYYAVFDGHGGRDAANYCAAHLHLVLAEQLRASVDAPTAIEKAFKIVDSNFCDRAIEMSRKAGSTAVVALIVDRKTLHVGWLGDSEAVLARDGNAQGLVKPHKPSVISEQERIERLGGEVISLMGVCRVNANLAVSRAVGDVEHKPYVSSDAEVTTVQLDDLCDFIVLGCDGLFDLLSYQDVVVNAYSSALSRRFDTSVAETLTKAAISKGSSDNITTIVVNLRDPKKWHFESMVFSKPEATERAPLSTSNKQSGNTVDTISSKASLAGGESSPVREVAAGFVSDTVEMALNKVNGAPPCNLNVACDLSPPEEEQRDLMASLRNDTPEADRLNPDAPEFVPSFSTSAPELPNQSSSDEPSTEATVVSATQASETMPKSESRDELVYEIDREHSTAPQAVQAELVNLDVSNAIPTPKAADGLSDSDEDLNSMVIHEDQAQPEIKLSELIVREQHIHVIPEESPSDEVASPLPESNLPEAEIAQEDRKENTLVELNGLSENSADQKLETDSAQVPESVVTEAATAVEAESPVATVGKPVIEDVSIDENVVPNAPEVTPVAEVPVQASPEAVPVVAETTIDPAPASAPAEAEIVPKTTEADSIQAPAAVEQVVDLMAGLEEIAGKSAQDVLDQKQVAEDLVDLASQILQGDVVDEIERSDPFKAACRSPLTETPVKIEDSQYLFSAEVGVHEEAIVPRAQPLLFEPEDTTTVRDSSLIEAMENMILDDGPKVVDAIEKLSDVNTESISHPASTQMQATEAKVGDLFSFGSESIELGSVKDVVEKLSAEGDSKEETVAAPVIPDSIPEAEGVQDEDSESDNDAQEWSFVKPVEQQSQPASEAQVVPSAAVATAAVVVATSAAAAVAATNAVPAPKTAEKAKPSPLNAAKTASASKASPAKTPATAKIAPAAPKASPKTATQLKQSVAKTTSPASSKPRVSGIGAKAPATTKPAAPKPPATAAAKPAPVRKVAPAKPAAATTTAPKTTSSSVKAPSAVKPPAAKPSAASKPAPTPAARASAAVRPTPAARAPVTSTAAKSTAAKPAAPKVGLAKAPAPRPTVSATARPASASAATTKAAASTVRASVPKTTSSSSAAAAATTAVKKPTSSTTTAASSATRVAAARTAAARPANKTTTAATTTTTTTKPKTGAVKTAPATGAGKVAPKSPVKKAVKQEKKTDTVAPAAAPVESPKENGSTNGMPQTNGHTSPQPENGSVEPNVSASVEVPTPCTEGQGEVAV